MMVSQWGIFPFPSGNYCCSISNGIELNSETVKRRMRFLLDVTTFNQINGPIELALAAFYCGDSSCPQHNPTRLPLPPLDWARLDWAILHAIKRVLCQRQWQWQWQW